VPANSRNWLSSAAVKPACAVVILLQFAYFNFDGLRVHWAADDPMNLFGYWDAGVGKVLWSNLAFFNGFYRPLGGLFYLPIYWFAKLDPLPYRIVLFCLLGLNVYLVYRFARLLGASERIAALSALFTTAHSSLVSLIYQTSVLYDILCLTFFFLAFNAYLRGRSDDRPLSIRTAALVMVLYVAAMNSKEMAISFPILLCLYELVYHPPRALRPAELARWTARTCWPGILAGALTAADLLGKVFSPDPLTGMEAYRPELSFTRWMNANVSYTTEILHFYWKFTWITAPLLWLVLFYLAWRRDRPHLKLAWLFIMVSTVPISFIPQRGGSCLYIPLVGWALFAATLASDLIELLAREPWLRRLPRRACEHTATALLAAVFFQWTAYTLKGAPKLYREVQAPTWQLISQVRQLDLHPLHGARILLLNAPFEGYDAYFVTSLVWSDKSLTIVDIRKERDPASIDPRTFDYVLRFEGDKIELTQPRVKP
jgi:hypothetical protein